MNKSNSRYNTAVGAFAAGLTTTPGAGRNNALGYAALYFNTIGECNTAIGSWSQFYRSSGSYNTAVGDYALYTSSIGDDNTALGQAAASYFITGSTNTFIGRGVAAGLVSGSNNIIIGGIRNADILVPVFGVISGNNNTIIGGNISGLSSTLNNNIILADGQGNIRLRALNTGQLVLPQYTSTTSFPGTATAILGVDSSGNVVSVSGGTGGSGTSGTAGTAGTAGTSGTRGTSGTGFSTIDTAAANRVLTAFSTDPNRAVAQPNLTFDAATLTVTGNAIVTVGHSYTGKYTPRTTSTATATAITPNVNSEEIYALTALATAVTINNPSGTAANGQKLILSIKDNGVARTITWGAAYRFSPSLTAPTLTNGQSFTLYLGFMYNSTAAKWDCISKADFY